MDTITPEKLDKYFEVTRKAIEMVKDRGFDETRQNNAKDILDMAERYFSDANHFKDKGDLVNAFACLNYAHGWLDAGARLKLFNVKDSKLFTVDDETN